MPAGLTGSWECALIPDVRGAAIDRQGSTHVGRESAHRKVPGQRKTRFRGTPKVGWMFTLVAAAYNLVRLPTRTRGRRRV